MNSGTRKIIRSKASIETITELGPALLPVRLHTSKEVHAQLGRCVICFQTLEYYLVLFIQVILDLDRATTSVMTSNVSFKHLATTLAALANERNIKERSLLNKILLCVRQAEELRNGLIHSHWIGDHRIKITTTSKAGVKSALEVLPEADMKMIADYMENLASCLATVMFKYLRRCKRENKLPSCALVSDEAAAIE